ncbi:hypothetical protein BDY17DRAFT_28826 [Neohortaea acidophila]|uniref:Uncharacterized protein n=1 Tax=Neohortaea acidophila TaxID=245834 RepID=A0A6A6PIS0_9PEZI|nr:uncharacterized protein BDY17DRAFT_28826 [Neohortaea acidophila]KAF2479940.1 hypothetical protein BDY17DRAFT_28826 [Neohortaea acidophila]
MSCLVCINTQHLEECCLVLASFHNDFGHYWGISEHEIDLERMLGLLCKDLPHLQGRLRRQQAYAGSWSALEITAEACFLHCMFFIGITTSSGITFVLHRGDSTSSSTMPALDASYRSADAPVARPHHLCAAVATAERDATTRDGAEMRVGLRQSTTDDHHAGHRVEDASLLAIEEHRERSGTGIDHNERRRHLRSSRTEYDNILGHEQLRGRCQRVQCGQV